MNDSLIDHQHVTSDIEKLETLLTRENKALTGTSSEHLIEIATEKQKAIEKIAAHVLTPAAIATLGEQTIAALGRCKRLNEENQLLVNQRLKVVRQANTIFGSHINQGSVALYDSMGKVVSKKRNTRLMEV